MSRLISNAGRKSQTVQILSYMIVLVSFFMVFISLNKSSFGTSCIILTLAIIALNPKEKNFAEILPFIIICVTVVSVLILSGKMGERGFNAPILHALKFVYLMFTVALSIGMRELPEKKRKAVLKVTMLAVIISTLISLYHVFYIDKYAIRYQGTREYAFVTDFNQFYGICLILCALFFVLITWRKIKPVWRYLPLCILLAVFVGKSLYATGVLLCLIGAILGFAVHKYNRSKKSAVLWMMVVFVALVFILLFGNVISDWIYNVTEPMNWIIRDRIRSVADTIFRTDHNLAYSYDRRDELAGYSLHAFRQHPLLGVGYSGYGYGVIGCHQEWQDMLGTFGLLGTTAFVLLMIYFVRITKRNINNKNDLNTFYISLVLFIILGFLNPCLSLPVLTAVFVISPNLSLLVRMEGRVHITIHAGGKKFAAQD